MNYSEAKPIAALAPWVKCLWALEYPRPGIADKPEPVIPDGSVEIIFNLSDRFRRYADDGSSETQSAALIAGQMDRHVLIGPSGNVRLFGIRFWPAGAAPFFSFPISDLAGRIEPLELVWGKSTCQLADMLWNAGTFATQKAAAEAFLLKAFLRPDPHERPLRASIEAIDQSHGTLRISSLARTVGMSERALERAFARSVGTSPKTFSRILRFQRVLKAIEREPGVAIARIAHDLGYFDQPHLIRDFNRLAGMTPSQYSAANNRITEVFLPE